MNDSLVWLSDHDRTILFEAGNVLRELALEDERARLGYLAGRLHGLAGRAPAEESTA